MRKDFYIFRHGETDYNATLRWQGQNIDIDLNEKGQAQAKNLAEKMKKLGIEKIYSSPLKRALQTAQTVADATNTKIEIIPELIEASVGVCEGMYKNDIQKKYPEIWERWYNSEMIMEARWPNGESKKEIRDRMFVAFNKMIQGNESIVGVASHGGAMRYFLYALGYGPHKMENTALFHVVYEDEKWIFDKLL